MTTYHRYRIALTVESRSPIENFGESACYVVMIHDIDDPGGCPYSVFVRRAEVLEVETEEEKRP